MIDLILHRSLYCTKREHYTLYLQGEGRNIKLLLTSIIPGLRTVTFLYQRLTVPRKTGRQGERGVGDSEDESKALDPKKPSPNLTTEF